jgi:hypothetical protein
MAADDADDLPFQHPGDRDPNDPLGRALSLACAMGWAGRVRLLLTAGADPGAADGDGNLPLNQAAAAGYREVVALLLDAGASPRAEDARSRSALLEASQAGHQAVAALLLERGADPDQGQEGNAAPIHLAAESGCAELVELLLVHGAAPDARNWCGDTALHIAFKHELPEVARRLLAHGARRDLVNGDGWSVDSLLDSRGEPRRDVSITYRASREPQELVVEIELVSWDRTQVVSDLPERMTLALAALVEVANAGGLAADRFEPAGALAELTVAPAATLLPTVARHTLRWQLRVAGIAPAGLALLLAPLAIHPRREMRVIRLTVCGSLALDNSPDTVVITGPDALPRLAALGAELRPSRPAASRWSRGASPVRGR